jgi:hypothetical protein
MNEFRATDAHRAAMPKLLETCDEASFVQWSQGDAGLPSWEESHRRMVTDGRASVNRPSPSQQKKVFPRLNPAAAKW